MTALHRIVACDGCARQFRVDRRAPGERFRCSCGRLLTVPEVRPHDAAVVHCSACGAPRQAGAPACGFCGGDFTLHERDLDTICPRCMARLSRRARFCHHCATPITVGDDAGSPTELGCPACAVAAPGQHAGPAAEREPPRLVSRRAAPGSEVALLECGRCAGIWLDREVFRLLAAGAHHGRVQAAATAGPPADAAVPAGAGREPVVYRPCPACGRLMHRQNYGRKSGVILDVCRDHGLWFDADELDRVLRWVERGGAERDARLTEEEARQRRPAAGGGSRIEPLPGGWGSGRDSEWWAGSLLWRTIEAVGGLIFDRLFSR